MDETEVKYCTDHNSAFKKKDCKDCNDVSLVLFSANVHFKSI